MTYPVTPQQLVSLLDSFPEAAQQIAAVDQANHGPLIERITRVIFEDAELVRHLAAIGRGVSIDQVRPGGMINMIAALGCIEATSRSANMLELVQIAASRLAPVTEPAKPYLTLVGSNDQ